MSKDDDFDDFEELEIEIEEEIVAKKPKTDFPPGSRVNLFFRSTIGPGEKLEKISVDSNISESELKSTVGQIFGLDPQDFHLSIGGRILDADDVLSNYDVEDGIEVLIIPISTAG
ncbi:MAG: ubiquitin-like domain-containing protein [Candidatus Odinarchaeota archaeon]